MIRPHLAHLRYLLIHKWEVLRVGRKLGVPLWQLLVHDLSKFSRAEWGPYTRYFFAQKGRLDATTMQERKRVPMEMQLAWAHHWRNNPHHWEYWCHSRLHAELNNRSRTAVWARVDPCPMPERYVREMVADWHGAARAKKGAGALDFYRAKGHTFRLHPDTRTRVEQLLDPEVPWHSQLRSL